MRTLSPLLATLLFSASALAQAGAPAEAAATEVRAPEPPPPPGPPVPKSPKDGAVPLPAQAGWEATLVLDNGGTGVWTVGSCDVFPHLACPDVVGLDDLGRCIVLVSYSGRWTPTYACHDGKWLGGLAHGDIDPRLDGVETYVGSQQGNIYLVRGYDHGVIDGRLIAHIEGREIHTIVAGDLDPQAPGKELIVFTRPGGLYRLSPTGEHGAWRVHHYADIPGRVRDAVVLEGPEIATVSRHGRIEVLRFAEGPRWTTVHETDMGLGRIARKPGPGAVVLYSTLDDGRVLRHERQGDGGWRTESIFLGPQGPRGLAAGAFDADPDVETVAVFGYSGKVQLLSRAPGAARWTVETLFIDVDKGHWLAAAELDGRNGTRELLLSGYSGRIVLLSRPPGYGRPEAVDPGPAGADRGR